MGADMTSSIKTLETTGNRLTGTLVALSAATLLGGCIVAAPPPRRVYAPPPPVYAEPAAEKNDAELPPKAYHLADFDAYQRVCGRRWAMYVSSLACPYDCGYCGDGTCGFNETQSSCTPDCARTSTSFSGRGMGSIWRSPSGSAGSKPSTGSSASKNS